MNRMLLHRREIQKDASVLGVIEKPNARGKRERVTQGRKKQDKREGDMKMVKRMKKRKGIKVMVRI